MLMLAKCQKILTNLGGARTFRSEEKGHAQKLVDKRERDIERAAGKRPQGPGVSGLAPDHLPFSNEEENRKGGDSR